MAQTKVRTLQAIYSDHSGDYIRIPVKRFSRLLLTLALIAIALLGLACGKVAPRKPPVGEYEIEDVEFTLKSPNGYDLSVRSIRPKLSQYPDEKFPAVLRLAGGWGPMTGLLSGEMTKKAAAGLIFVAFDSPMRTDYPVGSPERDYKGFEDQDDVAVVLKDIVENPQVDKDLIGVWTSSSGAILAAGVLGREEYQELSEKVAFFLDNEGPHCVEDLINDPSIN